MSQPSQIGHDIQEAADALREIEHLDHDKPTSSDSRVEDPTKDKDKDDDGVQMLFDGVSTLLEGIPTLVRALEAISRIHPFLDIAVGAFRVVIQLEVTRRDNDKKVRLLFYEMKNMMSALLQLQAVDPDHVAEGLTIKIRLERLVQEIAADIKQCANACDAYSKKRLLIRVIKCWPWDKTLQRFVKLFGEHKAELTFAISLHTGLGIDSANHKLDDLTEKMNVVIAYFEKAPSHDQQVLAHAVQLAGGPSAVIADDNIALELIQRQQKLDALRHARTPAPSLAASPRTRGLVNYYQTSRSDDSHRVAFRLLAPPGSTAASVYTSHSARRTTTAVSLYTGPPAPHTTPSYTNAVELQLLKQELQDDPILSIQKNILSFDRKFRLVQEQLLHEVPKVVAGDGDCVVAGEGDCVGGSPLVGSHEKITDPELSKIWKEKGWSSEVEARPLVLAVHDYFLQRFQEPEFHANRNSTNVANDAWTLEYINIMRVQPIIEAFDEDASGSVTIDEANHLTSSRPSDWSLLRWLAFWAIGWQVMCTQYKQKIYVLLNKMMVLRDSMRPWNQGGLDAYMADVRPLMDQMTSGFQENTSFSTLLPYFQTYIDREEKQLRGVLEQINYDLDALDTLSLVTGHRGIERNLYQLLYLILIEHYRKCKAAVVYLLHLEEMSDAKATILLINDAFNLRFNELFALFLPRRSDPARELNNFACGMFEWHLSRSRETSTGRGPVTPTLPQIPPRNAKLDENTEASLWKDICDSQPAEADRLDSATSKVLKHAPHCEEFYALDKFVETDDDQLAEGPVRAILGRWTGFNSYHGSYKGIPTDYKFTLTVDFHALRFVGNNHYLGLPKYHAILPAASATITGTYHLNESGALTYTFTKVYDVPTMPREYYELTPSTSDGHTLSGRADLSPSFDTPSAFSLVLKKDADPEVMVLYADLQTSTSERRTRSLWRFAISAVLHQVRQRLFSWSLVKERRDRKRRFITLTHHSRASRLTEEEQMERMHLSNSLTPADRHLLVYTCFEPFSLQGTSLASYRTYPSQHASQGLPRDSVFAPDHGEAGQGRLLRNTPDSFRGSESLISTPDLRRVPPPPVIPEKVLDARLSPIIPLASGSLLLYQPRPPLSMTTAPEGGAVLLGDSPSPTYGREATRRVRLRSPAASPEPEDFSPVIPPRPPSSSSDSMEYTSSPTIMAKGRAVSAVNQSESNLDRMEPIALHDGLTQIEGSLKTSMTSIQGAGGETKGPTSARPMSLHGSYPLPRSSEDPVPSPQPLSAVRRARVGYYNRRGDHLHVTDVGDRFVVYAPPRLADPEDLKHYPSPSEGWLNHKWDFVKYDPRIPELPASLCLRGRPPLRPYEFFVEYVDIPLS